MTTTAPLARLDATTSATMPTIESTGGRAQFFRSFDGAYIRSAHWPAPEAPGRGGVLILPGRTEFIEKYLETVAELQRRNLAAWVLDWRGQGASERILPAAYKGHIDVFSDYLTDLNIFATEALRGWNQGPLHILAHSMGSNIGLHFLHDHPGMIAKAIHIAPMICVPARGGIVTLMSRIIAESGCAVGLGARYVPGGHGYGLRERRFAANPLTKDEERFWRTHAYIDNDPTLATGPPTLAWLRAGMRSGAALLKPAYAQAISTPSLLICAGDERVVNNRAIYKLHRIGLPGARIEIIPGSRHEILGEQDHIRAIFWSLFDDFTSAAVS